MKLAYVNAFPEKDQLHNFIQTYTEECIKSGSQVQVNWNELETPCVISVYDDNTLVGIGCSADVPIIHVRPTYEYREIETMVNKLLQAESKFGVVHG
ncbi:MULTISPECIES: hypothetical protein [Paenibacillus]|uniref:Uncharacterized protein n=2 Tax=Paenibacillus TaxID=44249 RepID=A0A1V4HRU5_9BACL|nr:MULTISPECIES: hypothetical protein [Paenibacillus]MEC0225854.1 hypothetical protein [Paenibacillus alba]NQX70706.1 hypothetical protein [Paenibacillus alba]OPH61360.1 hypothetical protein BC351_15620 [Paenibacillus ferrarius]